MMTPAEVDFRIRRLEEQVKRLSAPRLTRAEIVELWADNGDGNADHINFTKLSPYSRAAWVDLANEDLGTYHLYSEILRMEAIGCQFDRFALRHAARTGDQCTETAIRRDKPLRPNKRKRNA